MKHKKLKLLALPLAIASASAIGMVSGTLAYFTSQDKATVSIEAGQVKVSLLASDLKVYSLGVEQTDTGTVGEKTVTYFENHGYAYMEGNAITLDRITPGDKVTFDVKFKNESNVDIKYAIYPQYVDEVTGVGRTDAGKVVPHTGDTVTGTKKLSQGLTFTYTNQGNVPYDGTFINISAGSPDVTHNIAIELPADAGNAYQGAKSGIILNVYAIQQNAPGDGLAFDAPSFRSLVAIDDNEVVLNNDVVISSTPVEVASGVVIGSTSGEKHKIIVEDENGGVGSFNMTGTDITVKNVIIQDTDTPHFSVFMGNNDPDNPYDIVMEDVDIILDESINSAGAHVTFAKTYMKSLTLKNVRLNGSYVGFGRQYNNLFVEDAVINIDGSVIDALQYPIHISDSNLNVTMTVTNTILKNNISYSEGQGEISFTNCQFLNSEHETNYLYYRPYSDTTCTNCYFTIDMLPEPSGGATVVLDNCVVEDPTTGVPTAITVDYYNSTLKDICSAKHYSIDGTEKFVINGTTINIYE